MFEYIFDVQVRRPPYAPPLASHRSLLTQCLAAFIIDTLPYALLFALRRRYSLFVIVWKRPDTVDPHPSHAHLPGPLTEQQLLPLISWVRALAAMAPAATFLVVATHSNTPRPGESDGAYKASFASMLLDVNARIKLELGRIQEAYNAELSEIQRTLEKLKAQLVAQEIKKRRLGSP